MGAIRVGSFSATVLNTVRSVSTISFMSSGFSASSVGGASVLGVKVGVLSARGDLLPDDFRPASV